LSMTECAMSCVGGSGQSLGGSSEGGNLSNIS
jgi:hypothetical protein